MMNKTDFFLWLVVWFFTQVVSLISIVMLFTLGLILIEFLLYPLAMGIGALLASLTAVTFSNWLVQDDLQTPVNGVVLRCEVTAVILSLLLIGGAMSGALPRPPIVVSSIAAFILAGAATYFAIHLRQPPHADPHKTRRILKWLLAAFVSIPVTIFVASLFGWAGA